MADVGYLAKSAVNYLKPQRRRCPNCGNSAFKTIARKYLLTALVRCNACQLQYRIPTDTEVEMRSFYNEEYVQGATTTMPPASELAEMKKKSFYDTDLSYESRIKDLKSFGVSDGANVFEFGYSWGYGSYQLAQAGFHVKAHELSVPRAAFGSEHLGVDRVADVNAFVQTSGESWADVFFSSHVLEHVRSPSSVIALARKMLKPGGLFFAYTPNGSDSFRRAFPREWMLHWGKVHPNHLDDVFYRRAFNDCPAVYGSTPLTVDDRARNVLTTESRCSQIQLNDMTGLEVLFVARMPR